MTYFIFNSTSIIFRIDQYQPPPYRHYERRYEPLVRERHDYRPRPFDQVRRPYFGGYGGQSYYRK